MSNVIRRIAYGLALFLWLMFLPIWFGALVTMTVLMTVKVIGNILSGQSAGDGQTALDDLANQWPAGLQVIISNVTGDGSLAPRRAGANSAPLTITTFIYAAICWGLIFFVYRLLLG